MRKRINLTENRQIFDVRTTNGFIEFLESKSLEIPDSLKIVAKTIENLNLKDKLELLSSKIPALVKKVNNWFVIDAVPLFSYLDKLKTDYKLRHNYSFKNPEYEKELNLSDLSLIQKLDIMEQKNSGHSDLQVLHDYYHNKEKLTKSQIVTFETHLDECEKCKTTVKRLGFDQP